MYQSEFQHWEKMVTNDVYHRFNAFLVHETVYVSAKYHRLRVNLIFRQKRFGVLINRVSQRINRHIESTLDQNALEQQKVRKRKRANEDRRMKKTPTKIIFIKT